MLTKPFADRQPSSSRNRHCLIRRIAVIYPTSQFRFAWFIIHTSNRPARSMRRPGLCQRPVPAHIDRRPLQRAADGRARRRRPERRGRAAGANASGGSERARGLRTKTARAGPDAWAAGLGAYARHTGCSLAERSLPPCLLLTMRSCSPARMPPLHAGSATRSTPAAALAHICARTLAGILGSATARRRTWHIRMCSTRFHAILARMAHAHTAFAALMRAYMLDAAGPIPAARNTQAAVAPVVIERRIRARRRAGRSPISASRARGPKARPATRAPPPAAHASARTGRHGADLQLARTPARP